VYWGYFGISEIVRGRDNSLGAGLEHWVNAPPPPIKKKKMKVPNELNKMGVRVGCPARSVNS